MISEVKNGESNGQYLILIVCMYLFIFRDYLEMKIPIFGYTDEVFALLAFFIWGIKTLFTLKIKLYLSKINVVFIVSLLVFSICGLLGNMHFKYQSVGYVALIDYFINIKFWLSIYVGWSLFSNLEIRKYSKKISIHLVLLILFFTVLMFIDLIQIIKGNRQYIQLIFSHPTIVASVGMILLAFGIIVREKCEKIKWTFPFILTMMGLTFRSKAIGTVILLLIIYYFVIIRNKKIRVPLLVVLAMIAVYSAKTKIIYYFETLSNSSARAQLTIKSMMIAKDHFPFGSGFGTYGSYFSGKYYSPLYYHYGLNGIYGLRQTAYSYLSDTFWPMIFGQTGFIGLIAYLLMIWWLFLKIQKIYSINRNYYFAALGLLIYLMVSSTSEAAFVHPFSIPMGMIIGLIFRQEKFCKLKI